MSLPNAARAEPAAPAPELWSCRHRHENMQRLPLLCHRASPMVKSYGLTHVALAVRDAERALAFYEQVLGVLPVYREPGFIQAQTPGTRDVIVFDEAAPMPGKRGGVAHFGFRLVDPSDIDKAIEAIGDAGGTIVSHGDFVPGEPYVFFTDLDGYEVEIWYELPTPLDPG